MFSYLIQIDLDILVLVKTFESFTASEESLVTRV